MSERWDDAETAALRAGEPLPEPPVGALAAVLRDAGVEVGYVGGEAFRVQAARRIAAHEGLVDALVEAGVLTRVPDDGPSAGCCRNGAPITPEDIEREISGG